MQPAAAAFQNEDDREKIELFFSCRSLQTSENNNYQIIMLTKSITNNNFTEYGKTEVIPDNWNPNFVKTCVIDYIFEQQQYLKFQLVSNNNNKIIHLAECETTVGAVVGARNQTAVFDLNSKGEFKGKLVIRSDKLTSSNEEIFMAISAKKVANQRFFLFNSSPYLRFYKIKEGTTSTPLLVHQTEAVQHNLNPVWTPFTINLGRLCNADKLLPIKAEIWDKRSDGRDTYISEINFSINDLINVKSRQFVSRNPKKKKENQGTLIFENVSIRSNPQFIDYIQGGTQLALIVAVDFTSSNGYPHRNDSLHYLNPSGFMNAYQKAIYSCSEILLNYDYDKMVPIYGFGGRPRFPKLTSNQTLHCFPLNGKVEDPYCFNLEGIMEAYNYSLKNVELNGPTLFCPLLTEVMRMCQTSKEAGDNQYYILMILTDGQINDMEPTVKAIVDSSHLPLSVIIIGIGKADFANMNTLDGDEGLWDVTGRKAKRDLVQFVEFNKFEGDGTALAANVLEELPRQVVEYMKLVGKEPGKGGGEAGRMVLNLGQSNYQDHMNFSEGTISARGGNKAFGGGVFASQQLPKAPFMQNNDISNAMKK